MHQRRIKTMTRYALLSAACLWSLGAPAAHAATATIRDDNAVAQFDPGSQAGQFNWQFNGADYLAQQWYWYRLGSTGPEASIETLTLDVAGTTDTNFDGDHDTLFVRYLGAGFELEHRAKLVAGGGGSLVSDLAEQVRVTNTATSSLQFHLFNYFNFDLSGSDTVTITGANTARQLGDNGALVETVVTGTVTDPALDNFAFEAALAAATLTGLNDGAATTLTDTASAGPGDVTAAFQWDATIDPGNSFLVSKNTNLIAVPLPAAAWSGLVLLGVLIVGRHYRERQSATRGRQVSSK